MEAQAGVLVTAKAIQAKLAVPPYSVLVQAVEGEDALESMEVLVAHGVHTRKEAEVLVEVALAVTGLMAQTTHSDVAMGAAVPLEVVGQHPQGRLELEERPVAAEAEAEVLMPLVVAL